MANLQAVTDSGLSGPQQATQFNAFPAAVTALTSSASDHVLAESM